jgi:hypothetical protein
MNTDLAVEVKAMHAKLDAVLSGLAGIAFPRQTQAQRAKKLGIHASTLRRRLRIAKARASIGRVAA